MRGDGRALAVDMGNTIIELSPEEAAKWKDAAAPTVDEWVASMDEKGLDGSGLYARAQELIAEETAK